MKILAFFFMLLHILLQGAATFADVAICSSRMASTPEFSRAIDFLRSYQGSFALGKCQIELHICNAYSSANDRGDEVGDLLVIDGHGREHYVPLYFFENEVGGFATAVDNEKMLFHFESVDRLPNPLTQGAEEFALEIVAEWGGARLRRLELGYYLRKDFVDRHHRHEFQWTICE